MAVGILAFGSLVDTPGADLAAATVRRVPLRTPFPVEFARTSVTRHGAPTLIPVEEGGSRIPALLLVLDESVTGAQARTLLYRRETHNDGASAPGDIDWIAELADFRGTNVCLYTALEANIPLPLTGEKLARLAFSSASSPSGADRTDGISYLAQQKRRGIHTPLMPAYEEALLTRTGGRDLDEAWRQARSSGLAG